MKNKKNYIKELLIFLILNIFSFVILLLREVRLNLILVFFALSLLLFTIITYFGFNLDKDKEKKSSQSVYPQIVIGIFITALTVYFQNVYATGVALILGALINYFLKRLEEVKISTHTKFATLLFFFYIPLQTDLIIIILNINNSLIQHIFVTFYFIVLIVSSILSIKK
ncbi:hypothetical protein GF327_08860 [Candidatus Woesearchaeota archaeon]|nr:hypothetical protein [Candidatus Woesearchaeota archaeon]